MNASLRIMEEGNRASSGKLVASAYVKGLSKNNAQIASKKRYSKNITNAVIANGFGSRINNMKIVTAISEFHIMVSRALISFSSNSSKIDQLL